MNRQSNKITALYCRMAHCDGDMDGYIQRGQMECLSRYVKEHGLSNPQFFCDWGFSGITPNRPQFQRMIQTVKAGNVSDLVVLDLSRLGRRHAGCGKLLERILPRHGVTLHTVNTNTIYTPQDLTEMAAQQKALRDFCRKGGRK